MRTLLVITNFDEIHENFKKIRENYHCAKKEA